MGKQLTVASAIAVATFGIAGLGRANVVVGNFEGSTLDGFTTPGGQAVVPTLTTIAGATYDGPDFMAGTPDDVKTNSNGARVLKVSVPANTYWGPTYDFLANGQRANFLAATGFSLDVSFVNSQLNGGDFGPANNDFFSGFAQMNHVALTGGTASSGTTPNIFVERDFSTASGDSDSQGRIAQWQGVDHRSTITYNLAAFTTNSDGPVKTVQKWVSDHPEVGSLSFWITTQVGGDASTPSGNPIILVDNAQLVGVSVPEPTTLAALATAGVAVLGRRRRAGC